ncbi:Fe2+-enterobactin ABC transporter substrate-binding protein [Glutamicibacter sp.]|uniref:Fe2+-enterobactin ABC transporter substrate-binding protein n=1 Tax=Glutamicibacter sp. TaxID=1931995 RepID=UPI003D6C0B2F
MRPSLSRIAVVLCIGALAFSLGSCATAPAEQARDTGTAAFEVGHWPRTFTDSMHNAIRIPAKPERIVSTSVGLTGSLLALDAPVIASATAPEGPDADGDGFFKHWADVASDRKVEPLYEIGKFDLEEIKDQKPDLIVVAATGADSEVDSLGALRKIAPTIVVDYADKDWNELSKLLGEATGTEEKAQQNTAAVSERVSTIRSMLAIPSGTTASIISYAAHGISPIAKTTGPYAQLFRGLGFTVVSAPKKFDTSTQPREDFSFVSYNDLPATLTADATFLLAAGKKATTAFTSDESLAQLPSVQSGSVFPLTSPHLLDYYAAQKILDYFEHDFPGLSSSELE